MQKVIQPQIWSRLWAGWRCQSTHFGGPPEPGEIQWLYICMFSQLLDVLQQILASRSVPTDVTYQHTLLSMRCMLYRYCTTSWQYFMTIINCRHVTSAVSPWVKDHRCCLVMCTATLFSSAAGIRLLGYKVPLWGHRIKISWPAAARMAQDKLLPVKPLKSTQHESSEN